MGKRAAAREDSGGVQQETFRPNGNSEGFEIARRAVKGCNIPHISGPDSTPRTVERDMQRNADTMIARFLRQHEPKPRRRQLSSEIEHAAHGARTRCAARRCSPCALRADCPRANG